MSGRPSGRDFDRRRTRSSARPGAAADFLPDAYVRHDRAQSSRETTSPTCSRAGRHHRAGARRRARARSTIGLSALPQVEPPPASTSGRPTPASTWSARSGTSRTPASRVLPGVPRRAGVGDDAADGTPRRRCGSTKPVFDQVPHAVPAALWDPVVAETRPDAAARACSPTSSIRSRSSLNAGATSRASRPACGRW